MAEALYLTKLNVNGQEYQIKDANAATTEDLNKKQNVLENYSEALYPTSGGRSAINISDGKSYNSSIIVSASESSGASIEFHTNNGYDVNTLRLNDSGLLLNDESVLVESDLANKVGYADYDSNGKEIVFYESEGGTVLFSIDATDFIKDGMVSDVAISNGNLVITFNTDAGHNAISIPLTDIFNPANYYDKTAMDAALALKADASNVYTKSEADGKFLTEHQSLADYPTISTMNTALGQKANVSDIYTQTEIDNKLALKANSADLATVATTGSYDDLTDKPVIPEGVIVDAALSDTSENAVQNKVVKGALDAKQDVISDLATIRSGAALGATAYQKPSTGIPASDIASGVIPTVPTNVSAFTNDAGYLTQHQSLADYYTKTQVDTALASKANSADLATVATSGSYNDLTDKPTIPTQTTVSVTGETLYISTNELYPEE